MLPKNKAKFIKSLQLKKFREEHGRFAVEGRKRVLELLGSDFRTETLVCTPEFLKANEKAVRSQKIEVIACPAEELDALGSLKTNASALAVAQMRKDLPPGQLRGLILVLDGVSDPGNLGALLRVADWYGMPSIVASPDTVDFYNPKVLQASMGSFCRVRLSYLSLESWIPGTRLPVYAASPEGEDAHHFPFVKDGLLVLGNEAHGISAGVRKFVHSTIGIPSYGKAESLNVAAAAAVLCDNYRRIIG